MMIVGISIGVLLALVVVAFLVLRPREYYPAESCGYTCPNTGACDGCDCGYP